MLKPELVQPLQPTSTGFAEMIVPSASIAFVAVLETLISAKLAKDRVDRGFSEAGEMRGLTIAYIVCGLTGAMPPTGVFVRTSLNTNLGATHRTTCRWTFTAPARSTTMASAPWRKSWAFGRALVVVIATSRSAACLPASTRRFKSTGGSRALRLMGALRHMCQ